MTRRTRWGAALTAALLVILGACGGGGTKPSSAARTLRVAVVGDASSLDPIRGSVGPDYMILYPIYDTLISFTKDLEPAPGLAQSWEQVSPTRLKLTLRQGVTFHDGTPMDAAAVKYNLERAQGDGSLVQADLATVKSVKVEDPLTVMLTLTEPNSSLLLNLADRAGMMVSPKAAKANGGDVSSNPVGAGGWSFVEHKRGSVIRVKKFADYWDDDVERVAAIDFNIMADPKTRATSLRSGQQDLAPDISPADVASLEKVPEVSLDESARVLMQMVWLNRASEELADPRVRKALSLAVDRETLLKSALFGHGTAADGALPRDYWAQPPSSVKSTFDQSEARRLLAAAGSKDLTFDMILPADSATTRIAEILKDQWGKVGVTVNLIPREFVQAANDFFVEKKIPALLGQWTGRPDPAITYRQLFSGGGFYNPSGESPSGLDAALDRANSSTEQDERMPGLDAAAVAVWEDTSFVPLVFINQIVGMGDDVKGFEGNLLGKPKLQGVYFG